MNVRRAPQFALLPPLSASILKAAMSAGAQKATEAMGFTVLVRECVCQGWNVEAGLRGLGNTVGVVSREKTGYNLSATLVKTKREVA